MERLPDGREARIAGQVELPAGALTASGDSILDARTPGGLLGCAQIIRQFAPDFDPRELRDYVAQRDGSHDLGPLGSAAPEEMARTLADFDVPAHIEQAQSSEDLAHHLESGSGVLVALNLGELWNSAAAFGNGEVNAIAVALAVAREPLTGDILGWYLNDVVAKQFRTHVDAARMERAWLDAGGWLIVTDIARRRSI
ncbi:MAG TPA: hypothetical protein VKT77_12070 [Chthonomonadaceae bacterium]|nr:hypothetical protein [Chthonomonadaceae bacterium]